MMQFKARQIGYNLHVSKEQIESLVRQQVKYDWFNIDHNPYLQLRGRMDFVYVAELMFATVERDDYLMMISKFGFT